MADKYILIGGHRFPIAIDTPVITYDADPNRSFYNWQAYMQAQKPDDFPRVSAIRPHGKLWSKRARALKSEPQLGPVSIPELRELGSQVIQVVLHHDAALTAKSCYEVLLSRGLSTHFLLNWDGTLTQVLDIYDSAWATGSNNPVCIAIDLNNPAVLKMAKLDPAKPPRQIFKGRINRSRKIALGYTDAQYATLIALFKTLKGAQVPDEEGGPLFPQLAERFFPPYDEEGKVVTRLISKSKAFIGFMGHWHCSAQKWDPGPGFEWERVVAGLHGDKNSFPVVLPGTSNLTELTGSLGSTTASYYANTETHDSGGWYPIGAGQSWHSGIHLHLDEGSPVMAMMKGEIVAVRNAQRVDLGDPSFVLIRHDFDDKEPNPSEPIKPYFSLYMHLKQVTETTVAETIPWMETLLGGDFEKPEIDPFADMGGGGMEALQPRAVDIGELRKKDNRPFWEGGIVLCNIPVEPGDVIGQVGIFGTSEWNLDPQIHVEIMAPHQPDKPELNFGNLFNMGEVAGEWRLVEGEIEATNLISIPDIINPIAEAVGIRGKKKSDKRVLKTSDIMSFFVDSLSESAVSNFRQMITFHTSEWSPTIDWRETAAAAVGWPWETQRAFARFLRSWFPFMWMTEQVTEHAGFPETHAFFYYHPVHFLSYLAKNYSAGVGEDKTVEEASDDTITEEQKREKEEKEKRDKRIAELVDKQNRGEKLTIDEATELDELISQQDRHGDGEANVGTDDIMFELDSRFLKWEPGEWEPPRTY